MAKSPVMRTVGYLEKLFRGIPAKSRVSIEFRDGKVVITQMAYPNRQVSLNAPKNAKSLDDCKSMYENL
jgi:hypothetical protein